MPPNFQQLLKHISKFGGANSYNCGLDLFGFEPIVGKFGEYQKI